MNRQLWRGAGAFTGMLILILDSKTALYGASQGVELCLRSVIPALFPFLVLSSMMTSGLTGVESRFLRPLGHLLGIPQGAEGIFLTGLLGGYPVGAIAISGARAQGCLSEKSARRMMGFCCNAGPAFIFGIAGRMFSSRWAGWELWGIHIFSALAAGMILPGKIQEQIPTKSAKHPPLSAQVTSAIRAMGSICGWVVLMRVVIAFLERWVLWLLPVPWQVGVCGMLELTNGCCALGAIESEMLRFVICAGLLGFGGVCVALQASGAGRGVSMGMYLPGKILQALISMAMAAAVAGGLSGMSASVLLGTAVAGAEILCIIRRWNKKNPKKLKKKWNFRAA